MGGEEGGRMVEIKARAHLASKHCRTLVFSQRCCWKQTGTCGPLEPAPRAYLGLLPLLAVGQGPCEGWPRGPSGFPAPVPSDHTGMSLQLASLPPRVPPSLPGPGEAKVNATWSLFLRISPLMREPHVRVMPLIQSMREAGAPGALWGTRS